MRFIFNYKKGNIELDLKVCNWFERFSGLMFTRRKNAKALLFDFKKPVKIAIHSFFVFFPFVAVWFDKKNKVIDIKVVESFILPVSPKKSFYKLVEIPINQRYKQVVKMLNPRFK